ncbi:hypothetical protein BDQ17DRAFT_1427982 [Cyathus striatus]|nr:hypothetical protein BDQ17DRAFT_1427982 [Cyathus striatus]
MPSSLSHNSRAPYPLIDVKAALQRAKDASTITDETGQKVVDPARLFALATTLIEQFNTNGLLECLNMAIALFQEGLSLLPPGHLNQAPALDGFGTALRKRFGRLGRREDIDDSIECNRQALDLGDANDPDRPVSLGNLGLALVDRFSRWGIVADLEEALSLHEEALSAAPNAHPVRVIFLNHFEYTLKVKYKFYGQLKDLEKIVLLDREAMRLTPPQNNIRRAFILNNLAAALVMLFERTGQDNHLHEAISLDREALRIIPPRHPEKDALIYNLADSLLVLHGRNGETEPLNEAIVLHKEALRLRQPPHPQHSSSLNSLAVAFKQRFMITNKVKDLELSISMHKEATTLTPVTHPGRLHMLDEYACSLLIRYEQIGDVYDLNRATSIFREVLKGYMDTHPSRPTALTSLCRALLIKFNTTAEVQYLDESILHGKAALDLCEEGRPLRSTALIELGRGLSTRFQLTGDLKDLDEMEAHLQEAIELLPASALSRASCLHILATAFLLRFHETNKPEQLEKVIALLRETIEMKLTQRQIATLETSMSSLAIALKTRFRRTRKKEDLEEAVFLYREALAHLAPTHPHRSDLLDNLAVALKLQFDTFHESTVYLTEAISLHKEALSLTTNSHPLRAHRLNNLAVALAAKFDMISMNSQDVDEAIILLREAVDLRPVPHSLRYHALHNLGVLLYDKVAKCPPSNNALDLLEECISLHEDALNLLPHLHPETTQILISLSQSIFQVFLLSGDVNALELSVCTFRLAAAHETAPVFLRFRAARRWAELVDDRHPSTLEACKVAIGLLPRLAALNLDIHSRQEILKSGVDSLARNAARCALRSGDPVLAVEFLEEGRSMFWSQSLQLHAPIDKLTERAPELAGRFREISLALEVGSYQPFMYSPGSHLNSSGSKLKEREVTRLRLLHEGWRNVLQEIQDIEEFKDFLQPRRFSALQQAVEYPIAIFIPTHSCTDILLLSGTSITHIIVPDLGQIAVDQLVAWIRIASNSTSRKSSDDELAEMCETTMSLDVLRSILNPDDSECRIGRVFASGKVNGDDIFMLVLGVLWEKIMFPIVQALQLEKSDTPPIIRLLPCGPLTFLPIHASGIYMSTPPTLLSDFAIPTYIPTLSSVLSNSPSSPSPPPPTNQNLLAIIQPLPSAPTELRKLKLHIPLPILPSSLQPQFPQSSPRSPVRPSLQLEDESLSVAQLLEARVEGKELAFLCACEPAAGDRALPDEVIHLGATMLYAGFRGVVGTMWPMADSDGPRVADTFYKHYASGKKPGVPLKFSGGPRALHMATKRLIAENVPFTRWVPFIYIAMGDIFSTVTVTRLFLYSQLHSSNSAMIRWTEQYELRDMRIELAPRGTSDGCAVVSHGLTQVLVTVFGPREAKMRSQTMHDRANINVEVGVAAFSTGEKRKRTGRGDKRILEIASTIKSTFEPVIQANLYPRTQIDIYVQILQQDGSVLQTCINGTTLALITAGIPMVDFVCAVTGGVHQTQAMLDLTHLEENDVPNVTVAMMPRSGKVALVTLETRLHVDRFEEIFRVAGEAGKVVHGEMKRAVVKWGEGLVDAMQVVAGGAKEEKEGEAMDY